MSNITDRIFHTIQNKVINTLSKDSVPVKESAIPQVADAVTKEILPVAINANNAEKWFQSRIYIGLLTAGIGALAQQLGIHVSGADIQIISDNLFEGIQLVGTLMEVSGLLFAAIGRIKGAPWKPLFSRK